MALRPQQNLTRPTVRPAPTGGMDVRAPIGNMPDDVSVYSYNLVAAEFGLLLRPGYREWCIGLTGSGVLTIMPFTGTEEGIVDDKLFAATSDGIWDVTVANAPSLVQPFADNSEGAGHGVYCTYVEQGGEDWLLYADSKNGLFEYQSSADTWTQHPGFTYASGTPPDVTKIVFCMVHKDRLWVIEEGSSIGWYVEPLQRVGEVTPFYFGTKFPHGGRLYALFNWTVDGGMGVDDMLVAVSAAGDVIVYQGPDPGDTSWGSQGTYYVGDIPAGRRFGSEYSGELYLLSTFGLISMSDLLRGVDSANPAQGSLAFKIARPLRQDIQERVDELGWEPSFLPPLGTLAITTPRNDRGVDIQYVMNLAVEGWGLWRGVPALSIDDFNGRVFFGTADGRVCVMDTNRDNLKITPDPDQPNGEAIEFSVLSSYSDLGGPALHKQVQFVRPNMWSSADPAYEIKVLYDYDYEEPQYTSSAEPGVGDSNWDIGLWDFALWNSDSGDGRFKLVGTTGMGRSCAIAMRGTSYEELRLVSWDLLWTTGGPL